jgi:hypothetical protein
MSILFIIAMVLAAISVGGFLFRRDLESVLAGVFIAGLVVLMPLVKEYLRRKKDGFYIRTRGNADGGDLTYHENGELLTFYFDRVSRIIYVPSDSKWEEVMPEWARARKVDIVEKIIGRMGKDWSVRDKLV